ncbi:MAG: ATP-binding protein [Myxococcota bacterium]
MTILEPESTPSVSAGARFGHWQLERCLGEGGFGSAWLARDAAGHLAVVKLLSAPPGNEIRALAKIHHPAVVPALGAGTEPCPYLVMGLAPGRPLGERLEFGLATTALARLADGLAACHDAGVAHGDIKPDNVMFDAESGRVTVIDFGLAGGTGGTPRYAAPERPGTGAKPPADVYAWGLVAWEILAGVFPWPDDAPFSVRSEPEVPRLPEGSAPAWLGELVGSALHPDPTRRPTAAALADACEAHGVALPVRTADEVARQARTVFVARPAVEQAVDHWLADGQPLALVGPRGAGRSHQLARIVNELLARGVPYATLYASEEPWSGIESALADPSLPGAPVDLPTAADDITRAETAAEALIARAGTRLVLLVDDAEALDPGTAATLEVLTQHDVAIVLTTDEAPEGVQACALDPFSPDDIETLVHGILGPVAPSFVEATIEAAEGSPRDAVAFMVAAVDADALVWRRRSWVVVPEALDHHASTWVAGALPSLEALPAAARRLGGLVALAGVVDRSEALSAAEADDEALSLLINAGLVRGSASLQCTGAAATTALVGSPERCRDPAARLLTAWLARQPVPYARLGPLLAATEDTAIIEEHGPVCISAMAQRDIDRALEVATALWTRHPTPELAVSRSKALLQAGQIDEARQACFDHLGERAPTVQDVPILIALAEVEGVVDDLEARLSWIRKAVAASGPGALSSNVRLARAQASLIAGDFAAAEDDCLAVCAAPPEADEVDAWLRAKRLLSQVREQTQGAKAGLAVLDEIPAELGAQTREKALIEGDRGRLLWHAGDPGRAAAAMERAATFRRALPLVDRARLENNAGLGWYSVGDIVMAVACWERALHAFERIGAPRDAATSRVNLCQGYRELGRWARAETIGEAAVEWARQTKAVGLQAMVLGNLGDVYLWQRKLDQAEERYDEAQRLAEGLEEPGSGPSSEIVELSRRRCELAGLRGDRDWEARLDEAETLTTAVEAKDEVARVWAMRALAEARAGRFDAVDEPASRALAQLRELGATGELAIARLWISEAWVAAGQPDRAVAEAEAVVHYAEEFVRPPLLEWARSILERARPDRTLSDLERLTTVAVRVAMQASLGQVLEDLAHAAVDLVEVDRALVVLADGQEVNIVARAGRGLASPPSMSIVRRVLQSGREVVASDLEERGDLRGNASVVAMNLRAAMCMPLVVDDVVVGALYLDSQGLPGGKLREAASLTRSLAAHAAVAVRNAQLAEQLEERVADAEGAHRFANALLRSVPAPVVVAGEDGTTVDTNDAAVTLLAHGERAALPTNFSACLERLEDGLADEYQLRVPGQRWSVPVHVNRARVQTPEGQPRMVYALADLTPRLAAEAQQIRAIAAAREASAAKDRFLASMSHELRTPLNAIIGYTELVLEDVFEEDAQVDLGRILSAGRHLLGLIDDVLDISRIEAGRLDLNVVEQPLDVVFDEILAITRPAVLDVGARFDVEVPEGLGTAKTDHRRVRQVCTNLLMNAIQHSQGRTVRLCVHADAHTVFVTVADDGVGIAKDRLEMLFVPFVRLSSTGGGAGIGLSIAKRLAEQLGGDLSVESEVGIGSTFRFSFQRNWTSPEG